MFIIGEKRLIAACKSDLNSEYEMIDIGLLHYYLWMEVSQDLGHFFFGHGKYAVDVLRRF